MIGLSCGPSVQQGPAQQQAQPAAPLTNLNEIDFIKPYLDACELYIAEDQEKVGRAIDAVDGKIKRLDSSMHEQASPIIARLREQEVEPYVQIPERGFMTVNHTLIAKVQDLAKNPPKTNKERKRAMKLGQKVAEVMPLINALNSHLYEIQSAQNMAQIHVELCTSYPLLAAVAIGNARRHNLIAAENRAQDEATVRKVVEMSHRSRSQSAALLTLFASYQATVAGALSPQGLDQSVAVCRETLNSTSSVDDAEVAEVLDFAAQKLAEAQAKEAELKALAQQTMRPPPPMPNQGGSKVSKIVGSVIGLLGSLATGNVAGIIQNAVSLLPEDSPLGNAVTAGKAVISGDYRTALDAATRLAPKGSAIANARNLVDEVDSRADQMWLDSTRQ